MRYPGLKKWTSLFIVFAFLANQCSPLYAAQKKKSTSRKRTTASQRSGGSSGRSQTGQKTGLGAKTEQRVEAAVQAQSPGYWVNRGAQLAEANCDAGTVKCVLKFLKKASEAKDPTKATVCVPVSKYDTKNKVCMNAAAFAQGAVHAAVSNPKSPWLYYHYKQEKVWGSDKTYSVKTDPFPIRKSAPEVLELVSQWGVYYASDVQALNKYFKGVAAPTTCGNKGKNTCREEMAALIGLSFLAIKQSNLRKTARETATKILNDKWKSKDGGIVIKGAITALAVLNTEGAWNDIDTFLTKTSLPSVGKNALELLSVEGLTKAGIHVQSVGWSSTTQYYNNSNQRFTYLDTLAAQKQGFKYPYNNPAFQYPNNNVFEEIGYLIGRKAAVQNKAAQKLAAKIMKSAISYAEYKGAPAAPVKQRIVTTGGAAPAIPSPDMRRFEIYGGHWPVVVGIMDGATSANRPWSVTPSREGVMHLIQHVFSKGFWDLNAGTYRRVFNVATAYGDALTKRGTFPRMSSKSKGYIQTMERYEKIIGYKQTAQYADMAIFVVSAVVFVASIPDLCKSIYNAAQWLKDKAHLLQSKVAGAAVAQTATTTAKTTTTTAAQTTARGTGTTAAATDGVLDSSTLADLYKAGDPLFGKEGTYIKVMPVQGELVEGAPQQVITRLANGQVETVNVAQPGSIIISQGKGGYNRYAISFDTFAQNYTMAPELGEGWFRPIGGRAQERVFVQITRDIDIMAPWGTVEHAQAGAYLNITDLNRIAAVAEKEFYDSYIKAEPVIVQMQGAAAGSSSVQGTTPQLYKAWERVPRVEITPNQFQRSNAFERSVYQQAN